MLNLNVEKARALYTQYGTLRLGEIEKYLGHCDKSIQLKIQHGLSMSDSVTRVMEKTGLFNSSYYDSFAFDGLLHDIGRFEQYARTGSLKDYELESYCGIEDHGRLGEQILDQEYDGKRLIEWFLPEERRYDFILKAVVGNHTRIYQPQYQISFSDLNSIFQEKSLEQILEESKEEIINQLIGVKIRLLQEADNFELLQNVLNGYWKPLIQTEKESWVTHEVWVKFLENQPIMITEMKKKNSWTCNSGAILHMGLLPQKAFLRSTLEILLERDYLKQFYLQTVKNAVSRSGNSEKLEDPLIEAGYHYSTLLIKNIIALSDIVITKESREKALQLTKSMWKGPR